MFFTLKHDVVNKDSYVNITKKYNKSFLFYYKKQSSIQSQILETY